MFISIIPTYAQISTVKLILKLLYMFQKIIPDQRTTAHTYTHTHKHTHTYTHPTRNYICGHIYQDFVITTHYYIAFHRFNNS